MYPNVKFPLVSLYGSNFISNEWTITCMNSWKKITNISKNEFFILPDKALAEEEKSLLNQLEFKDLSQEQVSYVDTILENYPALAKIRKRDVTWKKILDVGILFKNAEKITIIDTDVFINTAVALPLDNCDLAYMREDIPAYRASWKIVWKEKMVPALNAGIIIVNPKVLDLDYLEEITKKYLIDCKQYWWTEQSAWACLAGRVSRRLLFSGEQVRVTSGTYKRNPQKIIANSFKYFGKKGMMKEYVEFEPTLKGGLIFHFAGPGKYMFGKSVAYLSEHTQENIIEIKGEVEPTLSLRDKIMISSRLFIKESFNK